MELLLSNLNPVSIRGIKSANKIWDENLYKASQIKIATGFISSDALMELKRVVELNDFPNIELLIGMHYFSGFTKQQYDAAILLHETLQSSQRGAVYVSNKLQFHGKMYSFISSDLCFGAIVGSSNLNSIVLQNHSLYEADCYINDTKGTQQITSAIEELIKKLGVKISDVVIESDKMASDSDLLKNHYGVTEVPKNELSKKWSLKTEPSFRLPVKATPKSNMNVYCGKGRLNSKKQYIMPRPWYEVEIIVPAPIRRKSGYPLDEPFKVITDDGWSFECVMNGTDKKNLRSQKDLTILGKWLKGRLEQEGLLEMGQPVTEAMLDAYGNDTLTLSAIKNSDDWLLDFRKNSK